MKRDVTATTHLLAEAIVHHLETHQQTIIASSELDQLRVDAAPTDIEPDGVVVVHCYCDRGRANPLLNLVIKDKTAVVDGAALTPCLHGKP